MKILIIYYSRTGNTETVAKAIAAALNAPLLHADEVTDEQLVGWDYIGLGSGIYWLRHDHRLLDLARRFPPGSRVFTFSTSGLTVSQVIWGYKRMLKQRLEKIGVNVIGQWHCPGHDKHPMIKPFGWNVGRPDAQDLESATAFARSVCTPDGHG